uniref:CAMPATH-1 antigen n=1 Tax=Spermophilus dauricus TaxID=99837 RepID=A0A8C9QBH3_SPEDA
MNSFLFLLFTLSLLVLTQIQTGVLGNSTASSGGTSGPVATTLKATTTAKTDTDGAPALSSLDGGSVLFFLTHILIHLFYLS